VKFYLSRPLRYIAEAKLWLHAFLTSAMDGDDWSAACQLSPEEISPETHPIRGSVGFRARANNWDMREISCHY